MKSCPTCRRTFEDSFVFCVVDGATLSTLYAPVYEPPPTVALPNIAARGPIPQVQSENTKDHTNSIVIGAAIVITLIGGLIVGATWGKWFGNVNSSVNPTNRESRNQDHPVESNPGPGPITQSTPPPYPTPAVAMSLNLRGNWSGVFANRDAVLYINSQDGNHFTGILKNTKGAIIAVSGDVWPDTRQISIVENRVIEGVKNGADWILGTNSGEISADGSFMNGRGRDGAGHSYTWSFRK